MLYDLNICDYFNSKNCLKNDLDNGYTLHIHDYLKYTVKGKSCSTRNFILNEARGLIILDYMGNLISHCTVTDLGFGLNYRIHNVKQVAPDYYTFILKNDDSNTNDSKLILSYYNKIINKFSIEKTYQLINNDIQDFNYYDIDAHSYIYKDRDHVYVEATLQNNNNIVIQEQKNGSVVWQWETKDHVELDDLIIRKSQNGVAINCFIEYNEDHLLISFRTIGIGLLNKTTGLFEWFIATKNNSLGFKDLPILQHDLEKISDFEFLTFNNNWFTDSLAIRDLLKTSKLSNIILTKRASIIKYNLLTNQSELYPLNSLAVPRMGGVRKIDDNILDINYGLNFIYDNNYSYNIYKTGRIQEINIKTGEILYDLKTSFKSYNVQRGLIE